MKAFKLIFLCVITCSFAGCFEMNEEIVVNNNGSGDYSVNMDLGKMLDMMAAFIPPDQMKDMEKIKDTTINMRDFIDTTSTLSAEKKALYRDGTMQMQMNMADKVFKINMKYPFKNTGDLQKLYASIGETGTSMGSLMNNFNPGSSALSAGGAQPEMKMISSYFDLETKKNSITRKLNKEKYAKLADDQMMQQMKQMGEMGGGAMAGMGDVKMNTIIKLPAPAKKFTGAKVELSTEKKILMLKNNMMDIFSHPEVFEFSVEY
jgi:hypothetical protein